ncbi:MAG: catechol 2,3-dioxygenase-like lactoylglutathione lyase family enzyme [Candidatus Azotimanducaceae bacterium]|jgi:catechol 2,3-dioxygenase-like lactoylglutathione lyase family enzyme
MGMHLEHANITVKSIDLALEFLSVAFPDFRRRGQGAMFGDASLGHWLHFGTDQTYLALQEVTSGVPLLERRYNDVGVNHIGFVTDEIYDLIKRLKAAGFEMSDASSMGQHPYRERAYFYDGCGFEWEFVQYLSEQTSERNDYET